jgi:hypothetical protein
VGFFHIGDDIAEEVRVSFFEFFESASIFFGASEFLPQYAVLSLKSNKSCVICAFCHGGLFLYSRILRKASIPESRNAVKQADARGD